MTDYSETNEVKDTQLNNVNIKTISAVALSENKVFIAHSSEGTYVKQLSATVCTISENSITKGTTISLIPKALAGEKISAVVLNENKVFIAHSYETNRYLYGMVCTINGTTITKGTDTQLSTTTHSGETISAVKLDEGKVFIAHSRGSDYYLYGIVCTISGTTITKGTDTQLNSAGNSGSTISAVALSENKIFIGFRTTDGRLLSIVCTISGTNITRGTDVTLSTNEETYSGRVISVVVLSENKVFIAHSYSSDYYLYGIVCTINETSIAKGTDTAIEISTNRGYVISAVTLSENKVLVVHGSAANTLYSILCDINGTTVTKGNDIQLSSAENSGSTISAVALNENNIFIGHSYETGYSLRGMVLDYLANLVKTITSSTEKIDGVAITSGQAGEMVTTVRPDDVLRATINATISTENYGNIKFENVELEHRGNLGNNSRVYTASKTLEINGTNYEFSFWSVYHNAFKRWGVGLACPQGVYISPNPVNIFSLNKTDGTSYYIYAGTSNISQTCEDTFYIGQYSTGEKATLTVNIKV